ncbi:cation diffusion facilitator family transporter [Marinibacterium profundimaris]|uniref:Cation diffusion facilitator family transporter n=1 Tax=Marinibacterium profundimaris TaxID=1679460 RepID=A0A225NGE2_9RHOB|nr:cation diffusion facilitator family transporter [Marinibacterium profundimaris]OWU72635.1 cation diffusion facilitator family transporter [Marinibacterium profundimaris]
MPHDHHGAHHGHSHGHGHHHHGIDAGTGDRRLAWAVVVNIGLTLAQVVGGILSGSLALIADALHNFSDAVALIIAVLARRIARRPADAEMSFGYGRAEMVAALVNYTTLVLLALYLAYEGIMRLITPEPIAGWTVVWIAALALIVDVITALLTFAMSRQSLNIRAAFLHNVADALGSVAVIVAGALVLLYEWYWVDAVVTLMISAYILMHVRADVGEVIRVLMLASPRDLDMHEVIATVTDLPGVESLHHVHIWQMQERDAALDAHVVVEHGAWDRADEIKASIKVRLSEAYGITHATLELECARHACLDAQKIGHSV